jgi:hypothetical protein
MFLKKAINDFKPKQHFSAFQDGRILGFALAAPIVYPLLLASQTILAIGCAVISTAVSVLSLSVAAGAALFFQFEFAKGALTVGFDFFVTAAKLAAIVAISALNTVTASPLAVVSLATRSAATAISFFKSAPTEENISSDNEIHLQRQ